MIKHELKKMTMLLAMLLVAFSAFAQSIKVTGNVIDTQTKEPLLGVTVIQKGTTNGVITDIDGISLFPFPPHQHSRSHTWATPNRT